MRKKNMRQVLANRVGHMPASIEEVAKYAELREDLKINVSNNH